MTNCCDLYIEVSVLHTCISVLPSWSEQHSNRESLLFH